MSKWNLVRLGNVCIIERGGSPRPISSYITDESNGINWIKIGDTQPDSMYINSTKEKIKPEGIKKSRYVKKGDFILSNSMSFGRPYILNIDGCIHDGWLLIRDNNNTFEKRFLYYALSSPFVKRQFIKSAVGGVVNNLNSELVRMTKVPLPSISEQKNIANVLDKTREIINVTRKQLEDLDKLIKATFITMFGNPVSNSKGWDLRVCNEISTKIGSGATPKGGNEAYKDFGISLIRSLNVFNGYFKYDKLAFIDEGQADKLRNVILEKDDVLLNITGASVARSCIVPTDVLPARVNQHVAIIRPKNEYINSIFLNCLLTDGYFQQFLLKIARGNGATREAITKQQIESLKIICPPIEKQKEFAEIVNNIEAQKNIVKQSLTQSQNLFNSLLSKYFD